LGDRFGGHIVSGHVDCVAEITERRETSGNVLLTFRVPETISRYIIVKGSVAVDGISLTVNTVSSRSFSVNIIPHTSAQTTLQYLKTGEEVKIETDIIGKYVERLLGPTAGKPESAITMKLLAENGFL
jgi:riboflavin synthase